MNKGDHYLPLVSAKVASTTGAPLWAEKNFERKKNHYLTNPGLGKVCEKNNCAHRMGDGFLANTFHQS